MAALFSLIASIASGEAAEAAKRARRAFIFMALAGVFALCGVGFLIGAGYVLAAERYGSFNASVGFAVGFVVLAILLVLTLKIVNGMERRQIEHRRKSEVTAVATTAAIAAIPAIMATRGGIPLLGLPFLGLVAWAVYRENTDERRPPLRRR